MATDRQHPASFLGRLRQQTAAGRQVLLRKRESLQKNWQDLSKKQKGLTAAALLLLLWNVVLQVEVLDLSKTVALQQVRISQLEKQAQKQNNLLYSASVTLNDIEKKWHSLNFRVLENTWRIEEPKKTQTPCDESGFPFY